MPSPFAICRYLIVTIALSFITSAAHALAPDFWRGTWRAPVLDSDGSTYKSLWNTDGLITEMQATNQNVYAYHVDQVEDLVMVWNDCTEAPEELGLAIDEESSREVLDQLFRHGTDLDSGDDAFDPDNHSGTKKTLLELIEGTEDAGLSLILQFQKYDSGSCAANGDGTKDRFADDELTRVANYMSHLSMLYPHVVAWFIDDFMAYLCDPWDDGTQCLDSTETVDLRVESEPAEFWIWSSSTKAAYLFPETHILSAEKEVLKNSDSLELTVTVDLSQFTPNDFADAGSLEFSFLTSDSQTMAYDPAEHCAKDGVLAVEIDGHLVLEDFLTDGHDDPNGTPAEQYESFELHTVEIPASQLILSGANEVEIEFSLRAPSGAPSDYDPVACATAGSTWSKLNASFEKSVYLWDLKAEVGDVTLDESSGLSVTYGTTSLATGVIALNSDLDLDQAAGAAGVILNISRNDGYVTGAEVDRYVRSICGRGLGEDCLVQMRGTRWKDKDPDLDAAIIHASRYGTGLLIGSATNDLSQLAASPPGGVFTEITKGYTYSDGDAYDQTMTRHPSDSTACSVSIRATSSICARLSMAQAMLAFRPGPAGRCVFGTISMSARTRKS